MSAPEVRAALVQRFGDENVPSERTIRDMIAEVTKRDPSESWTIAAAELDDIAVIAPVWAYALETGLRLTKQHADWVVRVRTAAPDLPPADAWGLAGLYAMSDTPIEWADALLAFAPWRDAEHCERYFKAANAGLIPSPPITWDLARRAARTDESIGPEMAAFFERTPVPFVTVRLPGFRKSGRRKKGDRNG